MTRLPLALLVVAVLSGCVAPPSVAPPSSSAASSSPAAVVIFASTAAEVEAVMTARLRALQAKDLTAFQATVDLTRGAFRRCQQETFDIAARRGSAAEPTKVVKV